MAVDNPTLILIPVGQPLGIEYRRDPLGRTSGSSGPDAYFRVRLGKTVSRLTDEQFGAWMLAHGAPDAHGSVVTLQSMYVELQRAGVAQPAEHVDGLLRAGLLRQVAIGGLEELVFARSHRLRPLMLGLGNSSDHPERFSLGLPNRPMVTLTPLLYRVVTRAALDANLMEAVIHAADHAAVADDKVDEPPAIVGALLGAVHDLLRVNAVYFDRAAAVPANGSTT